MNHKELTIAIKSLYDDEVFTSQHDIAVAINDLKITPIGGKQWTATLVSHFMTSHGFIRRKCKIRYRYEPQIGCRECVADGIEYETKTLAPWINWAIDNGRLVSGYQK